LGLRGKKTNFRGKGQRVLRRRWAEASGRLHRRASDGPKSDAKKRETHLFARRSGEGTQDSKKRSQNHAHLISGVKNTQREIYIELQTLVEGGEEEDPNPEP